MLRIKQNLPARSQNKMGEALILIRKGKGLPGVRIERAPSREGVSALNDQATPATYLQSLFCPSFMDVEPGSPS